MIYMQFILMSTKGWSYVQYFEPSRITNLLINISCLFLHRV